MDHSFALKHAFPLIKLARPMPVQVVDGRPISSGPILFETSPIPMRIGKHIELLSFYIICSPHYPVILGLSWLRLHNPYINWRTEAIIFLENPPATQETSALVSASLAQVHQAHIPSPAIPSPKPPPSPLPVLPEKYADFQDVFDKKQADTLPIHRPYDCAIDLLPGTQPPWGPIYGLTEPEQATLKAYIEENLAKGFI